MTQTHSKMLATRRRKKRGQKDLARTAKQVKKLGKQKTGASTPR